MSPVELGSFPPGWPINSQVLKDLGRLLDDGVILGVGQQRWLVAAANALSDALKGATEGLSTEPKTPARLHAAIDIGELVLCQAETNDNATPEEIERLGDALAGSTLYEVVSLVIGGMR